MRHTKMASILALLAVAGVAQSQTPATDDWSWTFRCGSETFGLLFEDSSLSTSVKEAIKEDICYAYTFADIANNSTEIYPPGDPKHGTFTGLFRLKSDDGCPSELNEWDYKLHNGHKYFHVEKDVSVEYLKKIALTNQYQSAAAGLSNFLATVNSITTNSSSAVMSKHIKYWWVVKNKRALRAKDLPNQGDFAKFVATFGDEEMLAPSILGFMMGTDELNGNLCYEPTCRQMNDGEYTTASFDLVFKKGQWRIALPFLDVGP